MKSKKFSLIACAASIVLSAGALVGTSYAWFSDSASNKGNIIQAGTFGIELEMYDAEQDKYVPAENADGSVDGVHLFEGTNWQGDDYQVAYLSLVNTGSIDLDFRLDFNITEPSDDGDAYHLSDILESFINIDYTYNLTADGNYRKSSWSSFTRQEGSTDPFQLPYGHVFQNGSYELSAGDRLFFAIALHLPGEKLTAEYSGEAIQIDLNVAAKQKKGEFPPVTDDSLIGSQEELTAALASLEDGGVLTLSPDIEVTEQVRIDKKNVTIVGNGATFDVGLDNAIYIAAGSSLTITGANFKGTASGKKYGIITEGNIAGLIVDSCTFTGNKYNMGHSIWINGGNSGSIVIQNSTIQRPINVHGSGSVLSDIVIQNNKFTNFGSGVFGLTITGSLKNVSILNNVYNQSSSAGLARFSTDFALSFENVVIDGNKPSSEGASGEMLYFYNDDAKTAVVAAVDADQITGSDVEYLKTTTD